MDKNLKDRLNQTAKDSSAFGANIGKTLSSIFRISVLSKLSAARRLSYCKNLKGTNDCCVLGNGPSLSEDFKNERVRTKGNDILCVNMFCSSPFFWQLKPKFYFLVDVAFFAPSDERQQGQVRELKSAFAKVDWEMYLVISSSTPQNGDLLDSLHNEHIKVLRMNSTSIDGFRCFRHWTYRNGLGMPRCQTVVNFALCAAINMGYKNIYLYGADHTWTRDLFVNEDNVVCYGDRHVYNKNLSVVKKDYNFAHLLTQFSMMFQSHYLLEQYSRFAGIKIWNCSSDSFLDAYERKDMK